MRTHLELSDPAKRRWVATAVRLARRRYCGQSFDHLARMDFKDGTPKWKTRASMPFHTNRTRQGAPSGFPKRAGKSHLDWACNLLGGLAFGLGYDPTQDYGHPIYLSNSQTGKIETDLDWALDFWAQALEEPTKDIDRLYAAKNRAIFRRTAVRVLVKVVAKGGDTICFAPRCQMSKHERKRLWWVFPKDIWNRIIWAGGRPHFG